MRVESISAELSAISDGLDRFRQRVADQAGPEVRAEREDLALAIVEAERAIAIAARLTLRAARTAAP